MQCLGDSDICYVERYLSDFLALVENQLFVGRLLYLFCV